MISFCEFKVARKYAARRKAQRTENQHFVSAIEGGKSAEDEIFALSYKRSPESHVKIKIECEVI